MSVTRESDLTTLTLDQINWLMDDSGYENIEIEESRFLEINASDEAQYEVIYNSPGAGTLVTNHAFVEFDPDGDPRLSIYDLVEEEDLFAD